MLNLAKPECLKKLAEFVKKGKNIYAIGVLRMSIAILFFLAATSSRWPMIIFILGLVFLLSALAIFMLGPKKLKKYFVWYLSQSILVLRFLAVLILVIGLLIVFAA